jgi:prolipoprotein diacylglyceryltransferase/protein-S-isoprenylcysteine O-methyltransferase Ste14
MALTTAGKLLYGATFVVLVPVALIAWAASTARVVHLPVMRSFPLGASLAVMGALLVLLGMRDLWVYGGGLPMNAQPPPHYVTRGAYRLLPHPIYTGFSLLCVGVSILAGSASGLWFVSPLVMLACAALVVGYEHHDLRDRFGPIEGCVLPLRENSSPTLVERLRCCLVVVLPWIILCVSAELISAPGRPLVQLGLIALVPFLLAPFFASRRIQLRTFAMRALVAMPIALALFLALPTIVPSWFFAAHAWIPREWFEPTPPNSLTTFLPSPGIICALLAAEVFAERWHSARWLFRGLAMLLALGLVLTGGTAVLCALTAGLTIIVTSHIERAWLAMRSCTERLANSWHEWRSGPVRLINHGFYAGTGGFLALWLATSLAGPEHLAAILMAAFSAVVGAALWAQYVEGSPQLLRPYGFYGGLLGGTLGAIAGPLFHTSTWMVLAAFSVGGPLAQALGRLRCLVQGCCHGAPASSFVGIRYVHPRSRVCRLTPWTDKPLHPTPLYSILWNGLIGLLLIRLWTLHAALSLIIGLYFILAGIGRFAEEAWRGEPQTRIVAGLRLYQWAAIASVILGAVFSVIASNMPAPSFQFSWNSLVPTAAFGLFVSFAMGLDFPDSNRRFSRLT